jgi:hypothetical protein
VANITGIRRRYLSARDTALYLGLATADDEPAIKRGVAALYQAVCRCEITSCKFGRRLRFDVVDLDAMMAKGKRVAGGHSDVANI